MFSFKNLLAKKEFPKVAHFEDAPETDWSKVSLGVDLKGDTVYWDAKSDPHLAVIGRSGSGKSLLLETVIAHSIQHAQKIGVIGIDMYKGELLDSEKYSPVVLGVATSYEESFEACRFAYGFMKENYRLMEEARVNHVNDLTNPPRLLLLMIDEVSTLLEKFNTEEDEEVDEIIDEMKELVGDIARLGRAAGVQLVLSSQQLNPKVVSDELWINLMTRVSMGTDDYSARGRGYLQVQGKSDVEFQAYRTNEKWVDEEFSRWDFNASEKLQPLPPASFENRED